MKKLLVIFLCLCAMILNAGAVVADTSACTSNRTIKSVNYGIQFIPEKWQNDFDSKNWHLYVVDVIDWMKWDSNRLAGYTYDRDKVIYISAKSKDPGKTVIHEFGHYVASKANVNLNTVWKERSSIGYYTGSYAETNRDECFAEAFAYYCRYGDIPGAPKTNAILASVCA